MANLVNIEGIGDAYALKLAAAGVANQAKLLDQAAGAKGRRALAEKTGISEKTILKWVNRADLARVKGIGEEYADLLEHAGVDTVPELAQRNGANLLEKMSEVNAEKRLVRKLPSLSQVESWIAQAGVLPRLINY